MKPSIYLFGIFSLVQAACNQTPKKTEPEFPRFYWEATTSCPTGYPIDVYSGELYGNAYADLYLGTTIGPWGKAGRTFSGSNRPIPNKLRVTWLSYIEDCFYHIDTDIDYDKMLEHFKETLYWRNARNELIPEKFNTINVGFAPGGTLVIWLNGITKTVEIGRYQGKKIEIPQEKVDLLDSHDRLIFQPKYRQETLLNDKIVPVEFQEKHKNEPIPFGLWDEYRTRYNWKINLRNKDIIFHDYTVHYYNGELIEFFKNNFLNIDFQNMSIPRRLDLGWKTSKNERFATYIYFNENEIFDAFKKISANNNNQPIELNVNIDKNNNFILFNLKNENTTYQLKKVQYNIFTTQVEF